MTSEATLPHEDCQPFAIKGERLGQPAAVIPRCGGRFAGGSFDFRVPSIAGMRTHAPRGRKLDIQAS